MRLELKDLCLHLNFEVLVKDQLNYRINREQEWSLMKDAVWSMSPEDRLCVTHSCFVVVAVITMMLTACHGSPNWSQITYTCEKCFPFLS